MLPARLSGGPVLASGPVIRTKHAACHFQMKLRPARKNSAWAQLSPSSDGMDKQCLLAARARAWECIAHPQFRSQKRGRDIRLQFD